MSFVGPHLIHELGWVEHIPSTGNSCPGISCPCLEDGGPRAPTEGPLLLEGRTFVPLIPAVPGLYPCYRVEAPLVPW